jgi:hypothetical protein
MMTGKDARFFALTGHSFISAYRISTNHQAALLAMEDN